MTCGSCRLLSSDRFIGGSRRCLGRYAQPRLRGGLTRHRAMAFTERSRCFRALFKPRGYVVSEDGRRSRSSAARGRDGMTKADAAVCATCEIEVAWPPIRRDGHSYCCEGCAAGGPCSCSYDQPAKADSGSAADANAGYHRSARSTLRARHHGALSPAFEPM